MKKSRFFSAVLAVAMICSFGAVSAYAGSTEHGSQEIGNTTIETPELTIEISPEDLNYEENADGTITLKGFKTPEIAQEYCKEPAVLVFPDEIDGKTITKITYDVDEDDAITKDGFVNPNSQASKCSFALLNGYGGFYIQLPSTLKEIGDHTFFCPKFVDDKLPEGLEKIGSYGATHIMFDDKLVMPSSLKYIGDHAFLESDLGDFVLNEGLEYIGSYAFCTLKKTPSEVTIPKSVKYLGWDAFTSHAYDTDEGMEGYFQKNTTFNIYGGGYVEQYMKTFVPAHMEGGKAGYKYTVIGQTDIEPSLTESVNGLKISGAIPDGAEFKAVSTTTKWLEDPIFCYEITLNKDGAVVQPDGYVTIYIPCEYSNGYVVHIDEETGEMENRNSIYVDGYYVFVTDHLSEYGIKFDSEPVKSEVSQPEQSQSEQSQPEQSQPEQSQPEQSQPEQSQPEQSQPEQPQSEQSQPEQSQPINPDNNVPKTGDSPITAAALIVTAAISGAFVLGIRKRNANHI